MFTSVLLMASLTSGANAPQHCYLGVNVSFGCYSCNGCYRCYGCSGCQGYFAYPIYYDFASSFGCHGCYGCYGWAPVQPYYAPPTYCPPILYAPAPGGELPPSTKSPGTANKVPGEIVRRTLLQVHLPADAKLYLDGKLTQPATGSERTIITPKLDAGVRYFYDLRVEVIRDGNLICQTRHISFGAGQEVRINFESLNQGATAQLK
jgi:uncharacterized protein (TIGR03000 family)